MNTTNTLQQEIAEDLFFGQVVIIWARWFLILAGATLVLWNTTETSQLVMGIIPVLMLMGINFFLHGRHVAEQPANDKLVIVSSVLDLIVITGIILIGEANGLESPYFIFYYPIVLAVGFVFPRKISLPYTVLAVVLFAVACFVVDSSFLNDVGLQKSLTHRLITIASMGGLGTFYWRIQRDRLRKITS